tara:strand:- start:8182 stop:8745 length:564 start_codon:yes stop_codon:yes gene_type:complete
LINTIIYQTLADRDNPDFVESNGPFKCTHTNSWLGSGYYFWDTFIENAKWWGEVSLADNYMICKATIELNDTNCFDLVGNTAHMLEFEAALKLMEENGLINETTTVSRVLEFIIKSGSFTYNAIRINPINSKSVHIQPNYQMSFLSNTKAHFEYKPPIQICIFELSKVTFKDYKVIYPTYYDNDIVI